MASLGRDLFNLINLQMRVVLASTKEREEIVIFSPPKTGSSALYGGTRSNRNLIKFHLKTGNAPFNRAIQGRRAVVVTRNPYDRIISGFLDKWKKWASRPFIRRDLLKNSTSPKFRNSRYVRSISKVRDLRRRFFLEHVLIVKENNHRLPSFNQFLDACLKLNAKGLLSDHYTPISQECTELHGPALIRDAERVDCKELNRFLRKYGIKLETINRTNYSRVPSKARNIFDIPCNKLSVAFTKEHLGPTQIKKINRLLADDLARFSYPIL